MRKILVYSHDTFGLGNIRRMLSISRHLIEAVPDVSILLITGSPMIHGFRIPEGLDYIKLPCLTRTDSEAYAVKSLGTDLENLMRMRADLVLTAAANFAPDLLLVDKKPFGVKNELAPVLRHLRACRPHAKNVLILRDILDTPEATIPVWQKNDYHGAIRAYYDEVHVLGMPGIFDLRREYQVPRSVSKRFRFCGYTLREAGRKSREEARREMNLDAAEKLVVVTPGGGEDGDRLLHAYLDGLAIPGAGEHHSLLVCGPEMKAPQRDELARRAAAHRRVRLLEFTDDLMSYLDASDLVISMGGYNTICEILTLRKRAIVVPRAQPVAEQWIRAERMAQKGLFTAIHPDQLTAPALMDAVRRELAVSDSPSAAHDVIELNALPQIAKAIRRLLATTPREPREAQSPRLLVGGLNSLAFAGSL